VRLIATHPAPHPSRYPLRWANHRDLHGRSRRWDRVDGPLYLL